MKELMEIFVLTVFFIVVAQAIEYRNNSNAYNYEKITDSVEVERLMSFYNLNK